MPREIIPIEQIAQTIFVVRGQKVMLDVDLAALYGVATKVLNQAVKRNIRRFPDDFMFRLSGDEVERILQFVKPSFAKERSRSQSVTLKRGQNIKYRPYAFTEQGVAIMRTFVKLRQTLDANRELARKFGGLERRVGKHDQEIAAILEAIRQLMAPSLKPRREIGFHVREKVARYRSRNGR